MGRSWFASRGSWVVGEWVVGRWIVGLESWVVGRAPEIPIRN